MTTQSINPTPTHDQRLADFADRIRRGSCAEPESEANEELRGLEETLLRLNRAFPRDTMGEELVKRMHADFGIRKRRLAAQEHGNRQTWWNSLFRSPMAMATAALVVVGMLALLAPALTSMGSSTSGTAGAQAKPIGFVFVLGALIILLALWSGRRK